MPPKEIPSSLPKIRTLRRSIKAVVALGLVAFAVPHVPAQVTDLSNVTGNDEARRRTKQIRDARQSIDDYAAERWRGAAYLLVELTPREDGSTSVEIAERDRLKLPGVEKADPISATVWIVPDDRRVFLRVNYLGVEQEVACSVPKKLRDRAGPGGDARGLPRLRVAGGVFRPGGDAMSWLSSCSRLHAVEGESTMTRIRSFSLVGLVVLLGGLALAPLSAQAALVFSWDSDPPRVEGVSPGGEGVFLGVARVPLGDSQRVRRIGEEVQASAGETGVMVPWPDSVVPPRSVWAVVDAATGAFALSSPSAELVPHPPLEILRAGESRLSLGGRWVEVLVVRPGGGSWWGSLTDGSSADRDGAANGAIGLEPGGLAAVGDAPALAAWVVGDVLIAIDLDTFAVSTFEVGGAP